MRTALALGLLGLLPLVIGCGNAALSTRLEIRVHAQGGSATTYELRCDPAGGTVPQPGRICGVLNAHPNLLAGGFGFDHSCPGGISIEVVGRRRGRRISVVFPDCAWVPAQGEGKSQWAQLLDYKFGRAQSYGRPSADGPLQSAADIRLRERLRESLYRREDALRADLQRLARRRSSLVTPSGLKAAGAITIRMLRELTELATTTGGYRYPRGARVFVATHRKAVRVLQGAGIPGEEPVYAIVASVGPSTLTLIYDLKTLQTRDWGIGPERPSTVALGPGRPLFP